MVCYKLNYERGSIIKNKVIQFIGGIIIIICFAFIINTLRGIEINWVDVLTNPKVIVLILICSCILAVLLYGVAFAWANIVEYIQPNQVQRKILCSIYIKSSIAKYLPGNIMNLVGRNVLAIKYGFKQVNIATSTLIEIVFFAGTTLILATLFSLNSFKHWIEIILDYVNLPFLFVLVLCAITCVFIAIFIINRRMPLKQVVSNYINMKFLVVAIRCITLYSIFFITSGIVMFVILFTTFDIPFSMTIALQIIGCYIISYFIGYITPGAPGGIGIREAILIISLSTIITEEYVVVATLLHRVITILSDVIIYLVNQFILERRSIDRSN
ncbi:MAG: hypothetical protein BEN18_02210 [Epulopiscium sp. Nuni2H_MBin001]|nr:MAG: hypothetical protein BEN18_02210 [Epulopiscium sp. Nuni2H_MBin001]